MSTVDGPAERRLARGERAVKGERCQDAVVEPHSAGDAVSAGSHADPHGVAGCAPGDEFRFGVLGPLEITDRLGDVVVVPSGQQRTLLVSLLLSAGRPVTVDALTDRLWPDHSPARARGAVQTYVARLRRLFGRGLIERTSGGGYRIAVPARHVDLHRFRELLHRSR